MNGLRLGARATIAPTFKSRLAQPSSRLPMPGASGFANAVTPTRTTAGRPRLEAIGLDQG